jgi:hypothetical protein
MHMIIIFMASTHVVVNKCSNCSKKTHDGIVRNSKFYCNSTCYDDAHKTHAYSSPCIIKKCLYCTNIFNTSVCPGVEYEKMWFCSNDHFQLANPRPKIVYIPSTHIIGRFMPFNGFYSPFYG